MWPRGDVREPLGNDPSSRRAKPSGLSGFVSFKRRKDAEVALRELDGASWSGSALRVGWSKAVPNSGKVLYGNLKDFYFIQSADFAQVEETRGPARRTLIAYTGMNDPILVRARALNHQAMSDTEKKTAREVEKDTSVMIGCIDGLVREAMIALIEEIGDEGHGTLIEFLKMSNALLSSLLR